MAIGMSHLGGGVSFEPGWERDFLSEYREAGRVWVAFAFLAAAAIYTGFALIVAVTEPHVGLVLWVRGLIVAALVSLATVLIYRPEITQRYYVPMTISGSLMGLGGVILLFILPQSADPDPVIRASPSFIFGLILHYAFLRLPVPTAALVGWALSAAALFWVPMVSGGSEMLRTGLFLVFTNVCGMAFCGLVERRERALYHQRRRAEVARAEARERQVMAEEAEQQKTRLIAAVSHDLRQPMSAAVAYIDVLRSRLAADDLAGAREPAAKAQAALATLGSTLDHLLTAARYDSGTEALRIELVELGPLLRDLHDAYVGEAEKRGVRLRFRMAPMPIALTTDARSILRVLGNLVSNAIKFTEPHPGRRCEVLVAARLSGSVCRIDVIDTGPGIPESQHAEVWKPYVQLGNEERDRARGLGLGLFLVQRIVEQLPEHSVAMRSRPGHGSRFTVRLPAQQLHSAGRWAMPDIEPPSPADLAVLDGAYVLVLEDDRDARMSIVDLLSEWKILAPAAATQQDLLAAHDASERVVDVLVCDYRLAGGTHGIDAISGIRQRLGYSPAAILITGEPDVERLRARAGERTTVLQKPFMPQALARLLARAVRANREIEER
jgi:signal transduction histidine kinase